MNIIKDNNKVTMIKLTEREYSEYGGFCVHCGEEVFGVEPDAREYECDVCGEMKVYGTEELLLMGIIQF